MFATELQLGDAAADPAATCCQRLPPVRNGLAPGRPDALVSMQAGAAGPGTRWPRWREAPGQPQPRRALGG